MNSAFLRAFCWNPCCEYDCCCCSLQSANLITGVTLVFVNSAFLITTCAVGIPLVADMKPTEHILGMGKSDAQLHLTIVIIVCCLNVIFLGTHIYGSYKMKAKWLLPHFWYGSLLTLFLAADLIWSIILKSFLMVGITCGYDLVLSLFLTISYNLYTQLNEQAELAHERARHPQNLDNSQALE